MPVHSIVNRYIFRGRDSMLDIRFVRSSPDVIRADLKKRNDLEKLAWVDDLLKKDVRSRELKMEIDTLRQRRNTIAREINAARKAGQDTNVLLAEAANLPREIRDTGHRAGRDHKCDSPLPDAPAQYPARKRSGGERRYRKC